MPNQQKQQDQSKKQKIPFPTLPNAIAHRISMKWLTMEALAKVNKLNAPQGPESRVLLLTSFGQIEGMMAPIASSYADSYREKNGQLTPDYASMVTHVRTDLMRIMEQEENQAGQQAQGQSQDQEQQKGQQQSEQGQQSQESGGSGQLQIVDAAPIISLTDVVIRNGQSETSLPQLTLFADQVIGFTLIDSRQVH